MTNTEEKLSKVTTVEEYLSRWDGEPLQWLNTFLDFMKKEYPEHTPQIFFQMPAYKFGPKMSDSYIAFALNEKHFTFHSLDFDMINEIRGQIPKAGNGKGCVKVQYTNIAAIPLLQGYCRKFMDKYSK